MQITIEKLLTNQDGGVTEVKWSMIASKDGIEIKDMGLSKFTPDQSASGFIPFSQLKESDVIGWVSKNVNSEEVERRLNESVAQAQSSSVAQFPWL
jgi:hypothetical protein